MKRNTIQSILLLGLLSVFLTNCSLNRSHFGAVSGGATGVAKANPVLNWFEAEKQKTIEYQKNSWSNAKEDFSNLVKKFGLLGKKKDVTQNQ